MQTRKALSLSPQQLITYLYSPIGMFAVSLSILVVFISSSFHPPHYCPVILHPNWDAGTHTDSLRWSERNVGLLPGDILAIMSYIQ